MVTRTGRRLLAILEIVVVSPAGWSSVGVFRELLLTTRSSGPGLARLVPRMVVSGACASASSRMLDSDDGKIVGLIPVWSCTAFRIRPSSAAVSLVLAGSPDVTNLMVVRLVCLVTRLLGSDVRSSEWLDSPACAVARSLASLKLSVVAVVKGLVSCERRVYRIVRTGWVCRLREWIRGARKYDYDGLLFYC
jgi:hypothetical protein